MSRHSSNTGNLGQRVQGQRPRTRFVEVQAAEQWLPGLLIQWVRGPDCWRAHVAWVADDRLLVATVDSRCVRPARWAPDP